jgi:hypothetical protein
MASSKQITVDDVNHKHQSDSLYLFAIQRVVDGQNALAVSLYEAALEKHDDTATVSRRELFEELSDAQWDLKLYADGCTTLCTALNENPINPVIYIALHMRLMYTKSHREAKTVLHLYKTLTVPNYDQDDTDDTVMICPNPDCASCVKRMKIHNSPSWQTFLAEIRRSLPTWTTAVYACAMTDKDTTLCGYVGCQAEISPDAGVRCRHCPVAYCSIKCRKLHRAHGHKPECSRILDTCGNPECTSTDPRTEVCGRCHAIAYCSVKCQKKHRRVHKSSCVGDKR